jgi:hypothetical protein
MMENTNVEILAEIKLLREDIFNATKVLIDYFEERRIADLQAQQKWQAQCEAAWVRPPIIGRPI